MSSSANGWVKLTKGDLLKSEAHALVNTVNCVGVMGKGVALQFKRAYPAMFADYVLRCDRKEVRLGQPYVFDAGSKLVVNFPTKGHWRAVSKLSDIEAGLDALVALIREWKIRSIAVPPLGCGNGQLDWDVVGPTLVRGLSRLEIPVELYVPHELSVEAAQTELFEATASSSPPGVDVKVAPSALALVEILRQVEARKHSWPVGRIKFQKLAYFATVAGVPTGLEFEAASFGPYAAELKRTLGRLQNNGLLSEERVGRMFETRVGPTYPNIANTLNGELAKWDKAITRVASLMARLSTTQCEIAATVHFAASRLASDSGNRPLAGDVIAAVEKWKIRRTPPLDHADIGRALVNLATLGWIDVEADETVESFVDELTVV